MQISLHVPSRNRYLVVKGPPPKKKQNPYIFDGNS